MKTRSKLNINPEKLLKNDDLIALRGGDITPKCQEGPEYIACFCPPYGYFAGCSTDCVALCKLFE